ncbi:exosome component 4 [Fomitiporia mediterranea MF3/22]|uniref:exosome component 4 n=1 Tax=Fomitiporia mediterranea (strain MF3/22) TaxID=694068 RepID=UPI0004409AF0|nr:exosome component 4 [Fomitiporia mediterranea MF3/22]EJD06491.1 exosome component 4 [Fomitiporia mediterranea MF3/22]
MSKRHVERTIKSRWPNLATTSASRVEILNDGGYRSDGRRQHELRDFNIDLAVRGQADGSAMVSQGLTQVLVTVFGPREARSPTQRIHNRAFINVEVNIASFSTSERRKRSRNDKRVLEFAAAIKSTFEPVIQTHLYPRSEIDIFVQVLQQDGGLLSASINATTLALITGGISLYDYVCAVSAGVHATHPLLDLNTLEENDVPHLTTAVMPRTRKVTLVTLETRLHADRFEEIFRLACDAGEVVHKEMRRAILSRTGQLVRALDVGLQGAALQREAEDDQEMPLD